MEKKETNFEHYKDELIKMALLSAPTGLCEFKIKNILKIETCAPIGCSNCNIEVKNWLDQTV